METAGKTIFILYAMGIAICLVLIVYLAIRRAKIKKKEDFEKRTN